MNHLKRLIALLLLTMLTVTAASADTLLTSWPREHTARRIILAGDCWYAMMGAYGQPDAELAVGDDLDALTTVYEDDASVWSFTATQNHAAWVQCGTDNVLRWMLYDRLSGKVEEIWREAMTDTRPCFSVGLDENALYYVRTDSEQGTAELISRSLTDGTETALYQPERPISAMTLRGEFVHLAVNKPDGWRLVSANVVTRDAYYEHTLPDTVKLIYDVDYDASTGFYALYYLDTDGREHAAVLSMMRLKNLYTFASSSYAVADTLEIADGHLYWGVQMNWSGNVTDHYVVVDYDLVSNRPVEYARGYWFSLAEDALLVLTFGSDGNYETCVLSAYAYPAPQE